MPRLLFEKTGNAVWMSHLDLMRVFQRSFKRANLPLTHTQGFNPRPSVSIALPMSVGVESQCELLDFALEGEQIPCETIRQRLNAALVPGVHVSEVYNEGKKLKFLSFMDCVLTMEYDTGIPENALHQLYDLFHRESLIVEKKGKNGITQQDLIPMIQKFAISQINKNTLTLSVRIRCQNPTLNPMQIVVSIQQYLPECKPDFVKYRRMEIYDEEEHVFR